MANYAEEKLDHIAELWDKGKLSLNALYDRIRRLDKSLCNGCRKPKDTEQSLCSKCKKRNYARILAKRKQRKKEGLCLFCGADAMGCSLCAACAESQYTNSKSYRGNHG